MYRYLVTISIVTILRNHLHVPKGSWQLVAHFYHMQGMLQSPVHGQIPCPPTAQAHYIMSVLVPTINIRSIQLIKNFPETTLFGKMHGDYIS